MNTELYYFWLQQLIYFDLPRLRYLMMKAGGPEGLFEFTARDLPDLGLQLTFVQMDQYEHFRDEKLLTELYQQMEEKGLHYVSEVHPDYPEKLKSLEDAPIGLFYRGSLPDPDVPSVAVIGSRTCTSYGKETAYFLGRELVKAGVNVVSGMALGIDGASQRGALAGEEGSAGRTFAVLGGGADVCYPRENVGLYRELMSGGNGVISEKPSGYRALPRDFPVRNRIVAGLSDVLCVVEAAENSGSLITVNLALKQGKDVFAVPGRIGDRMSRGCNELIKSGAQVLTVPEDVLQYLGISVKGETLRKSRVSLDPEEKTVLDCMKKGALTEDLLMEKTAFSAGQLQENLLKLQIKGLIRKEYAGGYDIL